MTQEQLNEQLKDYCDKYSSFRYNDFHFPAGWSEEQMDVYRESRMEEYLSGIKELIQSEERNAVLSEAIALSDLIESQNNTVFDEWRAFKQFRNTLRDKLKHE